MDPDSSTDRVPPDRILDALHEQRDKYLTFLRWRSSASLEARRDPEDILQASLANAYERRDDYVRSGMALDAWFYRIMQNVLFDDHDFQSRKKRDYRKDKMIPDNSGSQYELGLKDTDSRPSTADNLTALKDQVNRVLAELSPEHQRIMVLIHYSSLKKEQAAVLLGIQGDAARKRYARARCRFRELWKTHYGMTGFR